MVWISEISLEHVPTYLPKYAASPLGACNKHYWCWNRVNVVLLSVKNIISNYRLLRFESHQIELEKFKWVKFDSLNLLSCTRGKQFGSRETYCKVLGSRLTLAVLPS